MERIVDSELGARLSKLFTMFESEPIAAASLGQVHRAALRDGRMVAVKVQRPDAREQVTKDLEALAEVAAFADRHTGPNARCSFVELVAEFRRTILASSPTCARPRTCASSDAISPGSRTSSFRSRSPTTRRPRS